MQRAAGTMRGMEQAGLPSLGTRGPVDACALQHGKRRGILQLTSMCIQDQSRSHMMAPAHCQLHLITPLLAEETGFFLFVLLFANLSSNCQSQ